MKCPACDAPMRVTEAKRGGLTTYCEGCGYQGFAKTPKAAAGLRARLAPPNQEKAPLQSAPQKKGAGDDWLAKL